MAPEGKRPGAAGRLWPSSQRRGGRKSRHINSSTPGRPAPSARGQQPSSKDGARHSALPRTRGTSPEKGRQRRPASPVTPGKGDEVISTTELRQRSPCRSAQGASGGRRRNRSAEMPCRREPLGQRLRPQVTASGTAASVPVPGRAHAPAITVRPTAASQSPDRPQGDWSARPHRAALPYPTTTVQRLSFAPRGA